MTITSQNKKRTDPSFYWLYAGIAFLVFSPCLILGQAYFSNDISQYSCHAQAFLKNQILKGHFPLWNPCLFLGQPFFADPNVMMWYPLNYLILPFSIPYGLSVFLFLHILLAAFGMHFWLKSMGLSENACRVGALSFSFSGFFWWQLVAPPLMAAFSWFPWFLACLEKTVRNWSPKWAFLTGLSFAVLLGLNFQSGVYAFYAGLTYFLFLFFFHGGNTRGAASPSIPSGFSWKKITAAGLFALWGGLPLVAQIIPTHEFYKLSYRSNSILKYDNFNGTFSMDPRSARQFFFPFLGVPKGTTLEDNLQKFNDRDTYRDNGFFGAMGYLGIWAPLLMLAAFWQKERIRIYVMAFMGLAAVLSAWGHHFPLHHWECLILPWIHLNRAPSRFLQIYVLSASVLSAYGYQVLEQSSLKKKFQPNLMLGIRSYALVMFLLALRQPNQTWREMVGLVLGTGGITLWLLPGNLKRYGRWMFLVSIVFPLLLSAWAGLSRGPRSNFDFERNFPVLSYLKDRSPQGRYLFDTDLTYQVQSGDRFLTLPFPQNSPEGFGIRSVGGNNPLFLQKSYDLAKLPAGVFTQLTAVKGLVWKHPMLKSTEIIHHSFPGAELYEPISPPSYVTAPSRIKFVPGDSAAFETMKIPGFDPAREVVLSESLPTSIAIQLWGQQAALNYSLNRDDPDDQVFKVRLDKGSLVVFSEIMFPGWKAWLDGEPTPLLTGNYTFRTLFVPSGEHSIQFRYEPVWFKPLVVGLLLWLASIAGYGWFRLQNKLNLRSRSGHA